MEPRSAPRSPISSSVSVWHPNPGSAGGRSRSSSAAATPSGRGRPGSERLSMQSRTRRALPHPRGFGPPQPYSSRVLAETWRQREAHLLRVLSAKNLDFIRTTFDLVCGSTGRDGLSAIEFVDSLMRMFSKVMFEAFDKQEFAIQILELFAAIDVRAIQ
jgi:hypothetical protein